MGLHTNQKVVLVEHRLGMEIEAFDSRLDMVLRLMDNGAIGGGGCYGDDKHQEALNTIEAHVAKVRRNIDEHWKSEGEPADES